MATRQRNKAIERKENKDKRPKAIARHIRIAPRKVKIVIDLLRGKMVNEALAILGNTRKSASPVLEKLIKSASANAENNLDMDISKLFIAEIFADQGPTMKRIRPRAKGMAARIKKRSSHITVILDQAKKEG